MILLDILPFDVAAARQFDDLRRQKARIGSRDLTIFPNPQFPVPFARFAA